MDKDKTIEALKAENERLKDKPKEYCTCEEPQGYMRDPERCKECDKPIKTERIEPINIPRYVDGYQFCSEENKLLYCDILKIEDKLNEVIKRFNERRI